MLELDGRRDEYSSSLREMYRDIVVAISMRDPILGLVAKRVKVVASYDVPTAVTNGKVIKVNPNFLRSLPPPERAALVAHELLHILYLHPLRLKRYDPEIANIAADAKVNEALAENRFRLPSGAITCDSLERLAGIDADFCREASTEELVEQLAKRRGGLQGLAVAMDLSLIHI